MVPAEASVGATSHVLTAATTGSCSTVWASWRIRSPARFAAASRTGSSPSASKAGPIEEPLRSLLTVRAGPVTTRRPSGQIDGRCRGTRASRTSSREPSSRKRDSSFSSKSCAPTRSWRAVPPQLWNAGRRDRDRGNRRVERIRSALAYGPSVLRPMPRRSLGTSGRSSPSSFAMCASSVRTRRAVCGSSTKSTRVP